MGDIHGCLDLLTDLHRRIEADQAARPVATATEIYLGDMVDRGPDSARIMVRLLQRAQSRDVVLLAGNHEVAMFDALEDLELFGDWLRLGGLATVASFGVAPDPEYDDAALLSRWQKKAGDFIRLFCRRLAPIHSVGDYLFVHAGLRPGLPLWEQRLSDLTLIREPFLSADHDFGPMVVHGHTPVAEVDFRRHRVNIDTGAYATGRLSCLVLQGEERRVLT